MRGDPAALNRRLLVSSCAVLAYLRAGLKLVTPHSLQADPGDLQQHGFLVLIIERLAADEPRLVPVQANQA